MAQYPAVIQLSSLNGVTGFQINGELLQDLSGFSVSDAGDVNGDGFADIIIGATGADFIANEAGASYVVFGKASGFAANFNLSTLNGSNGFRISGEAAGDNLGWSVSSAGDVNGDGFDDLVVGAVDAGPNGAYSGASYVVLGKASNFGANLNVATLNGANGFQINGEAAGDASGIAVSSAGDVNGDGLADVIIGANRSDVNGNVSGAIYVLLKAVASPANFNLSTLNGVNGFQINGEALGDYSGTSVSCAGDVNGDGFDDVIIGAQGADPNGYGSGASYVVFGKAVNFPATLDLSSLNGSNGFQISGEAANDFSGLSVSSAGDVNGDGFDDVIVGANGADPNGTMSGASYVVFGKASGFSANLNLSTLNGTNGFQINGETAFDRSGSSVSSAGDVNGDGFDDVIIGAYAAEPNGTLSGASYVVFGKASGFSANLNVSTLNGTNGFKINGEAAGDRSGRSVSSAGDVNGDGLDDLVIGARDAGPNGSQSGASYVVLGLKPDAAVFRIGTVASQTLVGGDFGDVLNGVGGTDILYGHGGNDTLIGGANNDTMFGGAGNDSYFVDSTGDVIKETSPGTSGGIDWMFASLTRTLVDLSIENLFLLGSTAINGTGNLTGNTMVGNGATNILNGLGGNDIMSGASGNDILNSGYGNDTVTGGNGLDAFLFSNVLNATNNVDTITDFSAADDTIRLENAFFTALTVTGTLAATAFKANASGVATDADDRILYNRLTGALTYDANGNAAGGAIQFATLATKPNITAADFFVV